MRAVRAVRAVLVAGALLVGGQSVARADKPITNGDYSIDFYDGVALGNTALVGMGGTGEGWLVGTAGVLINPAAIAVRQTTDSDSWNWDYHIDYLNAALSTDYDNNGTVSSDAGQQYLTIGLGGRYHDWAVAVTATGQAEKLNNDSDTLAELSAAALRVRFALAKWLPSKDIAIGLGVQAVTFSLHNAEASALPDQKSELFSITGGGIIGGVTWVPAWRSYRAGIDVETVIFGGNISTKCDPMDCDGYILPTSIRSPSRAIVGGAYRFAPTEWNRPINGEFRDERAVTVAADLYVTGSSPNSYGIEAFGEKMLQRSGEHVAVSVRGGAELEALPGRLRLRAGSYWEPQRFEGVAGRLHGTFGLEVRVFDVNVWGRRRGRISLTGDVADRYRNIGFSIGFWH
ncbi:MAG TPA: hypothetical protein VGM90_23245 [Kofleriaceae bacterium]|jgi:hypothetical protein